MAARYMVSLLSCQKSPRAPVKPAGFVTSHFFRRKKVARGVWILDKYSDKVAKLTILMRAIASIWVPPELSHPSTQTVPPYQQSPLNTAGYRRTMESIFTSGPVTFRKGATKGGQPCAKCLMSSLLPAAKSPHGRTNNFLLWCLLLQHVAC